MSIHGGPFSGVAPKYADYLLPNNAATTAKDCILTSGELRPLRDVSFIWTPTKVGTIKTIWRYAGQYWFHWLEEVDVVESPLANDAYGRVYWTGEAEPRYSTLTLATTGGGTNYPIGYYILGVPAPVNKATTPAVTPSDPNNIQSRAYIYTYVSAYGEEGPNADPSAVFDVTDGDSVTVTLPDVGPTGAYNITAKNIYRLNNGVYQFLAQIPVTTTTYVDTKLNDALGNAITSEEYDPPPAGLKGIFALANGSIAGFTNDELCISAPYLPHAWPVRNRIPFAGGIVSAGAFGNSILVTTANDKPYILSGSDPASMYKEQFEVGHACLSKLGTVDMGTSIIYPSPYGLVISGVGQSGLLTEKIIDPRSWSDSYNPSSIIGAKYGENYIGFNTVNGINGGFIFNTHSGGLTTTDIYSSATYTDPGSGDLFLIVGGDIVQFDAGVSRTMSWKSKRFILGRSTNFSRARVRAVNYPITLTITAENGKYIDNYVITGNAPFTVAGGFMSDVWQYEISSKYGVYSVSLGNSISDL